MTKQCQCSFLFHFHVWMVQVFETPTKHLICYSEWQMIGYIWCFDFNKPMMRDSGSDDGITESNNLSLKHNALIHIIIFWYNFHININLSLGYTYDLICHDLFNIYVYHSTFIGCFIFSSKIYILWCIRARTVIYDDIISCSGLI